MAVRAKRQRNGRSPDARKMHAGKYGKSTSSRQRGGGGWIEPPASALPSKNSGVLAQGLISCDFSYDSEQERSCRSPRYEARTSRNVAPAFRHAGRSWPCDCGRGIEPPELESLAHRVPSQSTSSNISTRPQPATEPSTSKTCSSSNSPPLTPWFFTYAD